MQRGFVSLPGVLIIVPLALVAISVAPAAALGLNIEIVEGNGGGGKDAEHQEAVGQNGGIDLHQARREVYKKYSGIGLEVLGQIGGRSAGRQEHGCAAQRLQEALHVERERGDCGGTGR